MTSRASVPRLLLEAHYYDGGLKTRHLSRAPRPTWCPPVDKAMLETDSFESESDVLLCADRFLHGGKRVSWLGVFVSAADRQFGARGNHLGVGLWLEEGLVLYHSVVLDALLKLVDRFNKGHAIDSLIDDVAKHGVVEQLTECVSEASGYEGLVSMPADADRRLWRGCLLGDLRSEGMMQKASDVLQWLDLVEEPIASRRILLVSKSMPATRPVTDVIPDTSETVAELLRKMPAAVSRLREERAEAQAQASKAEKRIESLETALREERAEVQAQASKAEKRIESLETSRAELSKRLEDANMRTQKSETRSSGSTRGDTASVSQAEMERVTRRILREELDRRLTFIAYGVGVAALLPPVLLVGMFIVWTSFPQVAQDLPESSPAAATGGVDATSSKIEQDAVQNTTGASDEKVETRYGILTIERAGDTTTVALDGQALVRRKAFGLRFDKTFTVGDAVVVLVGVNSGDTACLMKYFFLTVDKTKKAVFSPDFGACSDPPTVASKEPSIEVTLPSSTGAPVTFVYRNGQVTQDGKVVK